VKGKREDAWGRCTGPTPQPEIQGSDSLESREAHVGTLVRLIDGGKRDGKGNVGTIEQTYGHSDYLAMDVRFEDGNAELCWHHELAKVEEDIAV
jgi:hypothetical protein